MNRILRAAIMSAAVAATALAPAANAFAGDRYDRDRDYYRYEHHQVKKHHRHGRPVAPPPARSPWPCTRATLRKRSAGATPVDGTLSRVDRVTRAWAAQRRSAETTTAITG